jgi:ParB-like nuclease domain
MTKKLLNVAAANPPRPWPAERIELWSTDRLIPYPNNARLHSKADVDRIGASILQFGWTMPVLCDEHGNIIAGHARAEAAKALGLANIPVLVACGWTEEEKRGYRILDNQLAACAIWDSDLLGIELDALGLANFDLDLIGFDSEQLETILGASRPGGLTDPDVVPDEPAEPVSRPGDVWIMDAHRVGCGDSTVADDVGSVLARAKHLGHHPTSHFTDGSGREARLCGNAPLERASLKRRVEASRSNACRPLLLCARSSATRRSRTIGR